MPADPWLLAADELDPDGELTAAGAWRERLMRAVANNLPSYLPGQRRLEFRGPSPTGQYFPVYHGRTKGFELLCEIVDLADELDARAHDSRAHPRIIALYDVLGVELGVGPRPREATP